MLIHLVKVGIFVVILSLSGMFLSVVEAAEQKDGKNIGLDDTMVPGTVKKSDTNIELNAMEITGSLGDISLEETEIIGGMTGPNFGNIKPWQDPTPFPEEVVDLARDLIDPFYAPIDSEVVIQELAISTGSVSFSQIAESDTGFPNNERTSSLYGFLMPGR
jgi:hypothetical protein